MSTDGVTIFANAREVLTCETRDESSVHVSAAVAVTNGHVLAVGPQREILASYRDHETVDCAGGVLTPGFVDSHTHAVFGAWRSMEYEMRALGTPYMEIARRGGGIHASVRDVRGRTENELVELTRPRLSQMLRLGTTTVEVKSGYGLELEAELRMLRAVQRLRAEGPQDIVATFMGAHEVPVEFDGDAERFAKHVAEVMVPAVAADSLASFCDVFMEPGVFDAAHTRTVLKAAREHGLGLRLHADELETSGGAELAAELGAASADHLGAISDAGIEALAAGSTVATLLPSTLFFLGRNRYAPARRLLDAGATVALATDFNPGSSPSMSMPLVLTLACSQMGMTPREAIHAATAGGARALRLEDGRGMLAPGSPADLILWDVAEHREIPYRFGWPPIGGVWKRGARVAGRL